jgi:hypothetical protein
MAEPRIKRDPATCTICGKIANRKSVTFYDGSGACQAWVLEFRVDRAEPRKKRGPK